MSQLSPKQKEEKVLFFLGKNNHKDALEAFFSFFSQKAPCEKDFVIQILSELNRLRNFEKVFETINNVSQWFPNDPDLVKAEKRTKKNYYFFLCEKANKVINTAHERKARFESEASTLDKLYKEKLMVENQKAVKAFFLEALKIFQKAHELHPDGFEALFGLSNCFKQIGDNESAKRVEEVLSELSKTESPEIAHREEEVDPTLALKEDLEVPREFDLSPLEILFEEKKYDKVLEAIDQILMRNEEFVPALVLKAKIHLQRKEFIVAENCIDRGIKFEPNNLFLHDFRLDFLDHKFKLLTRGGTQFLKKGIQLGPTLGNSNFQKAINCFESALRITAGDSIILDHLYTALMYVDEKEKAKAVKQEILIYSPGFETTFDKHRHRSMCFIVQCAFPGEENIIRDFRRFRNFHLLHFPGGIPLNSLYHRVSPRLVRALRKKQFLVFLIRQILNVVWNIIKFF